jgi:hypothetical protein
MTHKLAATAYVTLKNYIALKLTQVHYRVHKRLPLTLALSQFIYRPTLTHLFSKIQFNIVPFLNRFHSLETSG